MRPPYLDSMRKKLRDSLFNTPTGVVAIHAFHQLVFFCINRNVMVVFPTMNTHVDHSFETLNSQKQKIEKEKYVM